MGRIDCGSTIYSSGISTATMRSVFIDSQYSVVVGLGALMLGVLQQLGALQLTVLQLAVLRC